MNTSLPILALSNSGYTISCPLKTKRHINDVTLDLPVSSSSYPYSRFDHVSGVEVPDGARGVAITRLKVIDVLIEQLNPGKERADADAELDIDGLIERFKVKQSVPYTAQKDVSGAIFDVVS
ncbi:MAG: hypothetical protein LBG87_05150 [Spirochaetaceae bacterium]|jgi:hypothetical protein|nr:hypothetical protein [Spirochaetaceae bacterium]